jgi:hypothetical protein
MSRSVKFRRPSPNGHYDHQRSDSGFSDCESRTSNPDHDYVIPGFEDHGLYSIRQALETTRQESAKWRAKAEELEEKLKEMKELRNELEQTKAHMAGLSNENQVLAQENHSLTKANKDLVDQNAQLQETIKELKKSNRKSSGSSSPSASSATASESSDEKKVRRSSSRRPKESKADKDKEREREKERDKDREVRERERERRKEKEREKERAFQDLETERLRKRFDTRGDESDAKSSSTSVKSQRGRRDSYIEPLGHGAPRPAAPVPPSPSRTYSQYATSTAPSYSTAPAYSSIREPFGTTTAPRSLHPTVYVADEYASYGGAVDDEDPAYHAHPHVRSTRHPR